MSEEKEKKMNSTIKKRKMSGRKKQRFVKKSKKTIKSIDLLYYSLYHKQGDGHDSRISSEGENINEILVQRSVLIQDIPKFGKFIF